MLRNVVKYVLLMVIIVLFPLSTGFFTIDFNNFDFRYFIIVFIISIIFVTFSFFFFLQLAENSSEVFSKKLELFYLFRKYDSKTDDLFGKFFNERIKELKLDFKMKYILITKHDIELTDNYNIIHEIDKLMGNKSIDKKTIKCLNSMKKYYLSVNNDCTNLFAEYETRDLIKKKKYLGYIFGIILSVCGIFYSMFLANFKLLNTPKTIFLVIFLVLDLIFDIYQFICNKESLYKYYCHVIEKLNIVAESNGWKQCDNK